MMLAHLYTFTYGRRKRIHCSCGITHKQPKSLESAMRWHKLHKKAAQKQWIADLDKTSEDVVFVPEEPKVDITNANNPFLSGIYRG